MFLILIQWILLFTPGSVSSTIELHVTRYASNSSDSGNILDLVLTSNEHLVADVSAYPHSFNSDHIPVSFVVRANSLRPKNLPRMVYCYKNADFGGLRMSSQNSAWDTALSSEIGARILTRVLISS